MYKELLQISAEKVDKPDLRIRKDVEEELMLPWRGGPNGQYKYEKSFEPCCFSGKWKLKR